MSGCNICTIRGNKIEGFKTIALYYMEKYKDKIEELRMKKIFSFTKGV